MRAAVPLSIPEGLGLLLPAQWGRSRPPCGPSRLGAAVLREAWDTLGLPQDSRPYRDAIRFFLWPADPMAPMSLELACALAGVEPDDVRRCVRRRLRGT